MFLVREQSQRRREEAQVLPQPAPSCWTWRCVESSTIVSTEVVSGDAQVEKGELQDVKADVHICIEMLVV